MRSVVIIGGGLGGLFTGAILAKEGLHVVVLEKNANIGGGLQSFRRFGETFDTGMHVVGGMRKGGTVWKICHYLGIDQQVRLRDVDDDCTDMLYFAEDDRHYAIAKGKEGMVDSLARHFPEEREHLKAYVEAVCNMAEQVDLFNLRPSDGQLGFYYQKPEFLMAASDFIAQYVADRKLRSILAYMNPLYGGRGGQTPAYIHAIISSLYINGASRFVDGSSHFADLLAGVITEHGGEVKSSEGVTWIEVNDRHVEHVETSRGNRYSADCYIAAIHPCGLFGLMAEGSFPKAYVNRLNTIPNAHSAFSLYIKLRADSFPYINHSEYFMTKYDEVWNFSRTDKPWPLGFLLMTPPKSNSDRYSTAMLVTAPMPFEMVARWEDTTTARRGEDYERWKAEMAERLLVQIEMLHPGFRDCIEAMNTASPLTIRDYYGVKDGSICGFSKDCNNMALSQVPVVTKIKNLLLTGQNNNLHGFCGVPLTAINTCEAILGMNYIINRINECAES